MVSELTVIVKDDEKTLRKKHLIYEDYYVHDQDPIIKDAIDQTVKDFQATPEKISVKITLEIQ